MVVKAEGEGEKAPRANATKSALLETGAKVDVPLFTKRAILLK